MKALFNISYGLYVLTAKDEKDNGCIINTLQQVTSNPERISITINKDNYTTTDITLSNDYVTVAGLEEDLNNLSEYKINEELYDFLKQLNRHLKAG